MTTSQQTRDDRGGDEGHSNCDGDGKCLAATVTGFVDNDYNNDRQLPTTTQRVMLWWGQGAVGVVNDGDDAGGGCKPGGLDGEDAFVLTADSAPTLIADNANGGDGGITVFGDAFEDTVARTGTAGASGVGTATMGGGGGNYADPARAILDNNGRHLAPAGSTVAHSTRQPQLQQTRGNGESR